jgi:hypothetical protein
MRIIVILLLAVAISDIGNYQNHVGKTLPNGETWKEYSFPDDRFVITLPEAPVPHPDTQVENTMVYSAGGVTLRVTRALGGCDDAITGMVQTMHDKATKKSKPDQGYEPDAATIKQGRLDGNQFLEYEQTVRSSMRGYERWYCSDKKLYVFAARWPIGSPRPKSVDRIVKSFRLLRQ